MTKLELKKYQKDQLETVGIGDASFKCDEKSVDGDLTWKKIEKLLRMRVNELKDKVLEGDVLSYVRLYAEEMMANCLTKEKKSVDGGITWEKIEKLLRKRVNELKDKILEGDVSICTWLSDGGDLTWEKIEKLLWKRVNELKDKILKGNGLSYDCLSTK